MTLGRATALARPNIALIKYWGNVDPGLRIPANGSISMTLDGLVTTTTVSFERELTDDHVEVDDRRMSPSERRRVSRVLDAIRGLASLRTRARIASHNSFPAGAGLASSASAFAALSFAAAAAAGLALPIEELSRIARLGSGSACRSVWGGFVEWLAGHDHASSRSVQLARPEHWDLRDVIVVVSPEAKAVGSTQGHALADTSPHQADRIADAPRRLAACREAIQARDFHRLAEIVEQDSDLMHGVMTTSVPPLDYSLPMTLAIRQVVPRWRAEGLDVAYTQDAGPNLHLLCLPDAEAEVAQRLRDFSGVVDVLHSRPGGGPELSGGDVSG